MGKKAKPWGPRGKGNADCGRIGKRHGIKSSKRNLAGLNSHEAKKTSLDERLRRGEKDDRERTPYQGPGCKKKQRTIAGVFGTPGIRVSENWAVSTN